MCLADLCFDSWIARTSLRKQPSDDPEIHAIEFPCQVPSKQHSDSAVPPAVEPGRMTVDDTGYWKPVPGTWVSEEMCVLTLGCPCVLRSTCGSGNLFVFFKGCVGYLFSVHPPCVSHSGVGVVGIRSQIFNREIATGNCECPPFGDFLQLLSVAASLVHRVPCFSPPSRLKAFSNSWKYPVFAAPYGYQQLEEAMSTQEKKLELLLQKVCVV